MLSNLRNRLRLPAFMLGLLLAFSSAPAFAALPAADEQAVQRVILTDGLLNKLIAIKTEGQALGIKEREADPTALDSLAAMAREATRDPRTVSLFARHGINARDYVAASVALLRASMAVQLGSSSTAAANGTTAANVAFAKSRIGKIEALFADEEDYEDDGAE